MEKEIEKLKLQYGSDVVIDILCALEKHFQTEKQQLTSTLLYTNEQTLLQMETRRQTIIHIARVVEVLSRIIDSK